MTEYDKIGIYFEKEEKGRIDTFLSIVDHLFWLTLSRKQRKIYDASRAIHIFRDHGVTVQGYLSFLEATKELMVLTGLPFSLEADHAGLGSWEAWNAVTDKAFEAVKHKRKCKRKSKGK